MEINDKAPVVVSTEVLIDAPAEIVWAVQSDIRNWPDWNPSVRTVSMFGDFEPQTEFHWNADGVTMVSQLQDIEPLRRLLWTGRIPFIRGVHLWLFEEQDGKTRVRSEESLEGFFVRWLKGPLSKMLLTALENWLLRLKAESEKRYQAAAGA